MGFIREIATCNLPENLLDLEQEGFTLVWHQDSVEIWYEMTDEEKQMRLAA